MLTNFGRGVPIHLPVGRADIQLTNGIAGKIHPNPAIT
jgi:hypothetical protein